MQPLGSGFRFADRQTEIRASVSPPEALHIRVVDHFDNVGNFPIRFLEARLPEGANYGSQNLRMKIDGQQVSPEQNSDMDRNMDHTMMRASFDPVWEEHRPREIITEWDMGRESPAQGTVAASATAFYIADEAAFPLWQPPGGHFTQGGPTPNAETLTVVTPPDFRVLASGQPFKPVLRGDMVTHGFRIKPDQDFFPYVVAGRYQEQVVRTRQGAVSFWTFQRLDTQQARAAAARVSSSMRALEDFFGPASRGEAVVRVVEAPGELPSEFGEVESGYGGTSFPDGALLDSRAFSRGIANEDVLRLTEYELARTWFGWRVRPRPEVKILMGRGVGLFAEVLGAEARGQDQRGFAVASLLERYDQARQIAPDGSMLEPPGGYSPAESISTGYRAALFFVALEDLCGHTNLRAAFREIVQARANDDVGYEELRSALEFASGRDLAETFHVWLNRREIPDDFRMHYNSPPNAR